MRVLITGGSGLIGRALAANLAVDGTEVIILSRSPERVHGLPQGVRAHRWDGRTAEGWGSLADGAAAIVNLAGESISADRWTLKRKYLILQSRLDVGRAVVQAVGASKLKPRVIIQASGAGYYGPRGNDEITEESPTGRDFLAKVALDWEASTASVEAVGVRRAIVRTGVVLSDHGGALARIALPFPFFLGGRMGRGTQWFPWIHIDDEVAAIRFLIDNETASGPFNLTSPVPLTNAEFGCLLGKQLRRPALMPMPRLVLQLLLGEMATVLLDGQKTIPRHLLRLGFKFQFPEAASALKDLLD
jgi:uncharacterized protein (TIGR01777 family)